MQHRTLGHIQWLVDASRGLFWRCKVISFLLQNVKVHAYRTCARRRILARAAHSERGPPPAYLFCACQYVAVSTNTRLTRLCVRSFYQNACERISVTTHGYTSWTRLSHRSEIT